MPMNLLAVIASSRLPLSLRTEEEIDKVRILRAARLVIAFVPGSGSPFQNAGPERAAHVVAITERGRQELRRAHDPHAGDGTPGLPDPGAPMRFMRAAAARVREVWR